MKRHTLKKLREIIREETLNVRFERLMEAQSTMTLAQWEEKYGEKAKDHSSGSKYVTRYIRANDPAHRDLYHLSDYAVTTVSGMTVWLSPRKTTQNEAATLKASKGTFYFPTYEAARAYAQANGHPIDRLKEYEKGWAIQLGVSGGYVGPATPKGDTTRYSGGIGSQRVTAGVKEDATPVPEGKYFVAAYISHDKKYEIRILKLGKKMAAPLETTLTNTATGETEVKQWSNSKAVSKYWEQYRGKYKRDQPTNEAALTERDNQKESRAEQIARWERAGLLDPKCSACQRYFYAAPGLPAEVFAPRHKASERCESGKKPHCTCDRCW